MTEFYLFSGLFILSAFLSIFTKRLLLSLLFQMNSVLSMAVLVSIFQSSLVCFCLIFLNINSFVILVIMSSIFFDKMYLDQMEISSKLNITVLIVSFVELLWLIFKNKNLMNIAFFSVDPKNYLNLLILFAVLMLAVFIELEFLIGKNKNEQ